MKHSARGLMVALATATLVMTPTLCACDGGNETIERQTDPEQERHLTLALDKVIMTYSEMEVSVEVTTDMDMAAVIDVTLLDDEGNELATNTTSITARTEVRQTAKTRLPMSDDIASKASSLHVESPRAKNVIDDTQTVQEAKAEIMGEDMRMRHMMAKSLPKPPTTETKPCVIGTDLFIAARERYDDELPEQIHLNTAAGRSADRGGEAEPIDDNMSRHDGFTDIMDHMAESYNRLVVDAGLTDLTDENEQTVTEAMEKCLNGHPDVEFVFINGAKTPRLNAVLQTAAERHENAYLIDWASLLARTDDRVDENGLPTDDVAAKTLMSVILETLTPPKEERIPSAKADASAKEGTDETTTAGKDAKPKPTSGQADGAKPADTETQPTTTD